MLIDNYDSFTYILRDYLLQLHDEVMVCKNDELTLEQIIALRPQRIIISPGPKTPDDAGIVMQVIAHFHDKIPILGICLGHQALAQFFGGKVVKAPFPMHGKTSKIKHTGAGIFKIIPQNIEVMRYHSLMVSEYEDIAILPLAFTEDLILMAFKHLNFDCTGIQFHPESVLTQQGLQMLRNWAQNEF